VFERPADGTGEDRLVADPERSVVEMTATPDGGGIVFRAAAPPSRDILSLQVGAGNVVTPLLTSPEFDEVAPNLSPDGRWLAYASYETGNSQVYVRPYPNVDQGRWQVSSGSGGYAPVWSPDGTEIFYWSDRGWTVARIETRSGFRVVGSTEIQWASPVDPVGSPVAGGWYSVSPDGRRILAVRPASTDGDSAVNPELILVQNFFEELKARVPN
jgi:Tol biopolymer transport system component